MSLLKYQITLLFILINIQICGQLKKVVHSNLVSESDIYFDENQVRFSDLITFKFKVNMIDLKAGLSKVELNDIKNLEVKKFFIEIHNKYGAFEIVKLIPSAVWGDTLVKNKRKGKTITIPDWSQVFQLKFENLVPIDSIIAVLKTLPTIKYAEEPIQSYSVLDPNDNEFKSGNKWAFEKMNAAEAWEITKGNSAITIAIHDKFGNSNDNNLHEDLKGKVDSHFDKFGGHGTCVAGIVGAQTNNDIGIASLGWKLHLKFYNQIYLVPEILRAVDDGVDVINFSWVWGTNNSSVQEAIKTALANGIVCVAAAGNAEHKNQIPISLYPAAYNFGELGQVIAVSATKWDGHEETSIEGWNYSPGNNPLVNSTSSFIDVAAPGSDIIMLDGRNSTGYINGGGTSLSTAFVSALAGLILSINSTLTPNEVYDIITQTTDKIGRYSYNENGWNQYLGYGRINAYKALKATREMTNVSEIVNSKLPKNYTLEQNYPNPFNPSTKVKFTLPEESLVDLKVFDVLGNEIVTLVNEKKQAGSYEVIFDANKQSNIASGVYLFRLSANNFIEIKKSILIK